MRPCLGYAECKCESFSPFIISPKKLYSAHSRPPYWSSAASASYLKWHHSNEPIAFFESPCVCHFNTVQPSPELISIKVPRLHWRYSAEAEYWAIACHVQSNDQKELCAKCFSLTTLFDECWRVEQVKAATKCSRKQRYRYDGTAGWVSFLRGVRSAPYARDISYEWWETLYVHPPAISYDLNISRKRLHTSDWGCYFWKRLDRQRFASVNVDWCRTNANSLSIDAQRHQHDFINSIILCPLKQRYLLHRFRTLDKCMR